MRNLKLGIKLKPLDDVSFLFVAIPDAASKCVTAVFFCEAKSIRYYPKISANLQHPFNQCFYPVAQSYPAISIIPLQDAGLQNENIETSLDQKATA